MNGATQSDHRPYLQRLELEAHAAKGKTAYILPYTTFTYQNSGPDSCRSDDLKAQPVSYGSKAVMSGSQVLYGAYGIAMDSAGRILRRRRQQPRRRPHDDMNARTGRLRHAGFSCRPVHDTSGLVSIPPAGFM